MPEKKEEERQKRELYLRTPTLRVPSRALFLSFPLFPLAFIRTGKAVLVEKERKKETKHVAKEGEKDIG